MRNNELLQPELARLLKLGCVELQEDYRGSNARLYDSIQGGTRDADYYIETIGPNPAKVLELGSGTGRIAIPLAAAGHTVFALDNSPDMHEILRAKAPVGIRDRIMHVVQDMADFTLETYFDFVILGLNTVFSLTGEEERNGCFKSVRKHLKSQGKFIIDFAVPSAAQLSNIDGKYSLSVLEESPNNASLVLTYNRYEPKRQLSILNFLTLEIENKKISKGFLTPAAEYYPSPMEMKLLLESAGMTVTDILSDYSGRAFSGKEEGRDVIMIASPMKEN